MQNPDTKKYRGHEMIGDASMQIIDEIRRNTEKEYKAKPIEPDSHIWKKRETMTTELGNTTEPCFEGSRDDRSHGHRGRPFTKERSRSPARGDEAAEHDAVEREAAWRNAGHKLDTERAQQQQNEMSE